jgi:hypothetical protein
MIIVTTGSRHWTDEALIKKELERQIELSKQMRGSEKLTVIVGYDPVKKTPRGVDRMVYKWCEVLGIDVIPEPADWSKGRGAGFARNILMLEKYSPDAVVAFRAGGKSNGTDHCIKEARKRHIPVRVVHERNT